VTGESVVEAGKRDDLSRVCSDEVGNFGVIGFLPLEETSGGYEATSGGEGLVKGGFGGNGFGSSVDELGADLGIKSPGRN